MTAVEKALDDAARAGLGSVAILHGIGTGALMNGLRLRLRELPLVGRIEAGGPESGGRGITIAPHDTRRCRLPSLSTQP